MEGNADVILQVCLKLAHPPLFGLSYSLFKKDIGLLTFITQYRFSGTKAGVRENIAVVDNIMKTNNGGTFEFARDAEEQAHLWSARKNALWSMLALREKNGELWSTDVAVPLSRLADIIGNPFLQHPPFQSLNTG
jgi:FAD/FMN-containing dehydrogenase